MVCINYQGARVGPVELVNPDIVMDKVNKRFRTYQSGLKWIKGKRRGRIGTDCS